VLSQDKERTKTNKQRTVELNARAAATLERQRARTQLAGTHVFLNPITKGSYQGEQFQAREWMQALRVCGVRHRPPKELRDTSVTLNLSSGADAYWVAAQHGHSVITMLKDYAKWIPKADKGRNLAAMNLLLGAKGAGE
jgi:integrase